MTGISSPPLQINHDRIDGAILEAIRKVHATASREDTPCFLAGATARELLLHHVFGGPRGRRTLDADFGIAVSGWRHFQHFKAALIEQAGFMPVKGKMHRLIDPSEASVCVNLVPFGGVERPDHTIAWPPEDDVAMTVAGFKEALESAVWGASRPEPRDQGGVPVGAHGPQTARMG